VHAHALLSPASTAVGSTALRKSHEGSEYTITLSKLIGCFKERVVTLVADRFKEAVVLRGLLWY